MGINTSIVGVILPLISRIRRGAFQNVVQCDILRTPFIILMFFFYGYIAGGVLFQSIIFLSLPLLCGLNRHFNTFFVVVVLVFIRFYKDRVFLVCLVFVYGGGCGSFDIRGSFFYFVWVYFTAIFLRDVPWLSNTFLFFFIPCFDCSVS